jgi:hypothetical protein
MRIPIMLALLGICAAAHAGDVYKWVDAAGNVHYGDRPKQDATQVDAKPTSGPGNSEADVKTAQTKTAACEDKRKQLESYKKAATIKETDSLGRTREYTPDERKQLVEKTEQQAAEACKP